MQLQQNKQVLGGLRDCTPGTLAAPRHLAVAGTPSLPGLDGHADKRCAVTNQVRVPAKMASKRAGFRVYS